MRHRLPSLALAAVAALGLLVATHIGRQGVPGALADGEVIRVVPGGETVEVGGTETVALEISGVTDLLGFQCDLSFNSDVLEFTEITLGPFSGSAGHAVDPLAVAPERQSGIAETVPPGPSDTLRKAVNEDGGVRFFTSLTVPPVFDPDTAPDGSGVLVSVSFTRKKSGVTNLDLNDCEVSMLPGPTTREPAMKDAEVGEGAAPAAAAATETPVEESTRLPPEGAGAPSGEGGGGSAWVGWVAGIGGGVLAAGVALCAAGLYIRRLRRPAGRS